MDEAEIAKALQRDLDFHRVKTQVRRRQNQLHILLTRAESSSVNYASLFKIVQECLQQLKVPATDSFVLYGRVSGVKQPEWQRTGKLESDGFIMVDWEEAPGEVEEATEPDLVTVAANGAENTAGELATSSNNGYGHGQGHGEGLVESPPPRLPETEVPAVTQRGRSTSPPKPPRNMGSAIVAIAGGTVVALVGIGYTGTAAWQVQRVEKVAALNADTSIQPSSEVLVLQQHTERLRQELDGLSRVPNWPLFPYENAQRELTVGRGRLEMLEKSLKAAAGANRDLQRALALAQEAAILVQKPPHPLPVWQKAQAKWQEAIALLEGIPADTAAHRAAQERLKTYRANAQQVGAWVARLQGSAVLPQFFAALPPAIQTAVLDLKASGMEREPFIRACFTQIMPTVRQQATVAPVNTYPSPANFGVRLCEYVLTNPVGP
ncbi:MAG: hypothetical protein ACUVSQ_02145 [Pseudanabaenaceae cyanobacterium]